MVKYTPLYSEQTLRADPAVVDPDRRLRLVVSNVLMENRDGERWLETVRQADPDVIAAVETDQWWVDTASTLEDDYPHAVNVPKDDTYGMFIRSRLPIVSHETRHLVEAEVPSLLLTLRASVGRDGDDAPTCIRDRRALTFSRTPICEMPNWSSRAVMSRRSTARSWSQGISTTWRGATRPRCFSSSRAYSIRALDEACTRRSMQSIGGCGTRWTTSSTRSTSLWSSSADSSPSAAITSRCSSNSRSIRRWRHYSGTPDAEREDQEEADEMIDEAQELKAKETEAERQERVEEDQ